MIYEILTILRYYDQNVWENENLNFFYFIAIIIKYIHDRENKDYTISLSLQYASGKIILYVQDFRHLLIFDLREDFEDCYIRDSFNVY